MKKPKPGDRIEHTVPTDMRVRKGIVLYLLALQFVYEDEDGQAFCLYTEQWRFAK